MNILFVVPYVPNLVRVRSYNLIRFLSEHGNRVTVVTLSSTDAEREDITRLGQICQNVHAVHLPRRRSLWNSFKALPTGIPLQSVYSWHPALANEVQAALAQDQNGRPSFDLVHVEHLRGARYGQQLVAQSANGHRHKVPPVVWDSVDCISLLFRQASRQSRSYTGRIMTKLELKRTEGYEAWLTTQFDNILLTSPRDEEAFLELLAKYEILSRRSKFTVLPNGVDLDYFLPDPMQIRDPCTVVVSGKMSYHANVTMVMHLVNSIMPLIWAKRPECRLLIVGKDPSRELRALNQHPQIEVTGTVKDVRPYLRRATVALAPITYSAGIQNKVLEAMACGTPVVTSPMAVSSLTAKVGRDLLTAQDPEDFAYAVLSLLDNPARCQSLGINGRQYVETHHNWENIAARLELVYQDAIHQKRQELAASST
jgi:sugar transferase (PEP-CTERM/EpsH1 system associated)